MKSAYQVLPLLNVPLPQQLKLREVLWPQHHHLAGVVSLTLSGNDTGNKHLHICMAPPGSGTGKKSRTFKHLSKLNFYPERKLLHKLWVVKNKT